MDKLLLNITIWILLVGGLIGFVAALVELFSGRLFPNAVASGVGAGAWLVFSAITVLIKNKVRT